VVLKIDGASGEVLWIQHYASPAGVDETFTAVNLDSQDDIYVTGRGYVPGQDNQILVAKLASGSGSIEWMEHIGGTGGTGDIGWAVAMGEDDHPVITGLLVQSGDVAYTMVRKMNSNDGATIWEELVPGALNNIEVQGCWLEVLPGGDFIGGQRTFTSNGYDVLLQRFAGSTGNIIWQTHYDGPTHGGDDIKDLCLDSAGNILVAGVQDELWNYNFMALKFESTGGALLWRSNYDGPPGWYDVAGAVSEGPEGSVIVTGFSDGSGTGWDWATVAYDGADGSELWVERYDGSSNQSDQSRDVVCTPQGDVYVTGYGMDETDGKDFVTIRYVVDTTSAAPDTPHAVLASRAWPNPFNPRVSIAFDLPRAGHASLAIHDLRGQVVKVIVDGSLEAGEHVRQWDGRDAGGRNVGAGVYLATVRSAGQVSTQKLALTK
jgi:hypothetical protein